MFQPVDIPVLVPQLIQEIGLNAFIIIFPLYFVPLIDAFEISAAVFLFKLNEIFLHHFAFSVFGMNS